MSDTHHSHDRAPGDDEDGGSGVGHGIIGYAIGLVLATGLTIVSFGVAAGYGWLYQPGIPVMLLVLAVAQMGVHLVFFLHITTGPDNTNNVLALAFGVLIVALIVIGSLWIMAHLNHMTMSPGDMARHMGGF